MAWSPNSSRTPRRKSCGRNSSGAYQVLIQLWKLVPQRTRSGPLRRGVKPARAVPGSPSTLRITATASSGSKVSACSTQMIGAVASCTPRLIADSARIRPKHQPEHQHVPRLWIPPGGYFITPRCIVLRPPQALRLVCAVGCRNGPARGLSQIDQILATGTRVRRVAFGAGDFTLDV